MSLNTIVIDALRGHAERMQASAAALHMAADLIERLAGELDIARVALRAALEAVADPTPPTPPQEKAAAAEDRATPPPPLDPKTIALRDKEAAATRQIKWSEDTKIALLEGIPGDYDHPTFDMAFDTWRKRVQAYRAQMLRPHFREVEKARDAAIEKRAEAKERQRLAASVNEDTGEWVDPDDRETQAASL